MKIFNIILDFFSYCGEPDLIKVKEIFPLIEDPNITRTHLWYKFFEKNDKSCHYSTPLFAASNQCSKECYKVIEFLLEKGADPNFRCNTIDGYIFPLHKMIYEAFQGITFRMQMDYEELEGVDDEIKMEITGVKLLVDYGAEINIKDNDGQTPLDWSIRFEHKPAENYLRSLGAKRGYEISDEENDKLEEKLNIYTKKLNYHFVSWQDEPNHDKFIELEEDINENIPDF